jgi:hypothetical protein
MFVLPLDEVLETTTRRHRLPRSEVLSQASALLSKSKRLQDSLSQQIQAARQEADQTRGLLKQLLHTRGAERSH